jgi:formate-dependent nitrite reductase membrane component NrfD
MNTGSDISLLTVAFLYLMGISQAGVVFCAITRLTRAQWSKPYYRLAELSTMAFAPFAFIGFLVILIFGRDQLFYWLHPAPGDHLSAWLNINWLFIRNFFGLVFFYGLSFVYVRKSLRVDLAGDVPGHEADHRKVERELYEMSPWILVAFIVCNTLFAWDFAMMLIPHWHSTVFPIFFWFGNIFAGSAALIIFPALLGRTQGADSRFGPDQVKNLGMMITAFTLMWLYFFWAQFFVIWFGNLPHETEPLWRQMYGHYSPFFWTMMTGCFFVPFAAFIFAVVKRSVFAMCIIAFGINVGILACRYLMVVPALADDASVFANWAGIVQSIGLAAGFVAVLVLLAKRLPVYSNWELALKPLPRRH